LDGGVIGVVNPIKNEEDDSHCTCHRIASLEVNPSNGKKMCHFALKTKLKEIFRPVEVIKMFEKTFTKQTKMAKPFPTTIGSSSRKPKKGFIAETMDTTSYHFH